MVKHTNPPRIPLPTAWPRRVKSAMLHVVSLAQYAIAHTRSWAANCQIARLRLKAENDQLRQHVALLTEELRIKDARLMRIPAHKRPHYLPTGRMSILELRAARAWSVHQTADAFLVTAATIRSTSSCDQPTDDHASNHANTGLAAHPVPAPVRLLLASQAIDSLSESASMMAGDICRSCRSDGQRRSSVVSSRGLRTRNTRMDMLFLDVFDP